MSAFSDFMEELPDGPIGLAVSGGSDSVALLLMAVEWARDCERTVSVATVDHGLRPEAAAEAEGVATLCRGLGVAHTVLPWDGQHSGNTQDAARRARQWLIGDWAKTAGLVAVATGHTQDDQAETFLLRLKRGSGVDGLAAMARTVVKDDVLWVRPLLEERRADLRKMLVDRGVAWVDDPSNRDTVFDRIKMRNALETLKETGLTVEDLSHTAAQMQRARSALEAVTQKAAVEVAEPRIVGSVRLDIAALSLQPEEIQLRLLAHALRWVSGASYRPRLTALKQALAAVTRGQAHSLSGCLISAAKAGIAEVSREVSAIEPSDGRSGAFDGRWVCERADGLWRPLGADGLQHYPHWRDTAEHRNSLRALPSLWYNNELKSVPFLDKTETCKCRLRHGPEHFFSSIVTH